MKEIRLTLCIVFCFVQLPGSLSHKEEECIEVGFARSSYLTVDQGYKAAKEDLVSLWQNEDKVGNPSYRDFSPQTKNVTRAAILLEETSKNIIGLIRKTRVGKRCREEWLLKGIEKHVTPLIQLDKDFAEGLGLVMSFRCLVGSPFPNVDGTCINEEGPDMGAIGAKFLRLLSPTPGQGGFTLRGSSDKEKSLPSAREVGKVIRSHLQKPSVTALLTEFSHFIASDSFSIPESPRVENINCCENPDHIDCAPIFLEKEDPMYSTIKCFNFKRSAPAQAILGNRESLSMISTYLDATPIYGATNEIAFKLKEGYFGYLNCVNIICFKYRYPTSIDDTEDSNAKKKKNKCEFPNSFKGCFNLDPNESYYILRMNNDTENLRLLLILEHNYLAEILAEINPHFDDALLYNEARRILIAQYNAIIYGEFVPLLVGEELAKKHNLLPGSEGPAVRFIPEVNPGILTSFALAAYRNPAVDG
ncbi:Chorion peroxidase [Armadillidium nasatum]|uniref:Chorion peroxidase n=1 Tax=Armadillidium nasatum TaxID=96803 RepID=A0A5N5STD5_9CRUS|nr:Chorion peroxidase [Armadillidium nasatum]